MENKILGTQKPEILIPQTFKSDRYFKINFNSEFLIFTDSSGFWSSSGWRRHNGDKNWSNTLKSISIKTGSESIFNFINFKTLVDEYIDNMTKFQDKALNNLFVRLQSPVGGLPSVVDTPEQMSGVVIDTTIGKLEYWECFKAINDKWIAGYEYNNKTFYY